MRGFYFILIVVAYALIYPSVGQGARHDMALDWRKIEFLENKPQQQIVFPHSSRGGKFVLVVKNGETMIEFCERRSVIVRPLCNLLSLMKVDFTGNTRVKDIEVRLNDKVIIGKRSRPISLPGYRISQKTKFAYIPVTLEKENRIDIKNFTPSGGILQVGVMPWSLEDEQKRLAREEVDRYGMNQFLWKIFDGKIKANEIPQIDSAELFHTNYFGQTALHLALATRRIELVNALIEAGLPLNVRDQDGYSPLHLAVHSGAVVAARSLLEAGADINLGDKYGFSPFYASVASGSHGNIGDSSMAMTKLLLHYDPKIDLRDKSGMTPLIKAAARGKPQTMRLLIANGADLNAIDGYGMRAIDSAIRMGHQDAVEVLIKHGASVIKQDNIDGLTPLHRLSQSGPFFSDIAHMLLEAGADINSRCAWGKSPLHYAAWNGNKVAVDFLIKRGANVNAIDDFGHTVLHEAVASGDESLVALLLAHNADPNKRDRNGQTPLFRAYHYGNLKLASYLIKNGADPSVRRNDGKRAEEILVSPRSETGLTRLAKPN